MTNAPLAGLVVLIAGVFAASCGLKGDLATPPPLFGDPNRAEPSQPTLPQDDQPADALEVFRDELLSGPAAAEDVDEPEPPAETDG